MAWHGGTAMPRYRAENFPSTMPRPATAFSDAMASFQYKFSDRHGGFPPQNYSTATALLAVIPKLLEKTVQ
jgi:hypothetical protein